MKIFCEVMTARKFRTIVYGDSSLPRKRFCSIGNGGVFYYFVPSDLKDWKDDLYFVVKKKTKIVGLSKLEKIPYKNKTFWIAFLSIDPEYQDQGYATRLAEFIFEFFSCMGCILENSVYSKEGMVRLKPLFTRLAEKYPKVNFTESSLERMVC